MKIDYREFIGVLLLTGAGIALFGAIIIAFFQGFGVISNITSIKLWLVISFILFISGAVILIKYYKK